MNATDLNATAGRESALDRDGPDALIRDLIARVEELEARLRRVAGDVAHAGGIHGSNIFLATPDNNSHYSQASPTYSGTNLVMDALQDIASNAPSSVTRSMALADQDDAAPATISRFCIALMEFPMGSNSVYVRMPQTIHGLPKSTSPAADRFMDRTYITVDGGQSALIMNGNSTFLGLGLSIGWQSGTNEAILRTDGTGNVFFGPPVFTAN